MCVVLSFQKRYLLETLCCALVWGSEVQLILDSIPVRKSYLQAMSFFSLIPPARTGRKCVHKWKSDCVLRFSVFLGIGRLSGNWHTCCECDLGFKMKRMD